MAVIISIDERKRRKWTVYSFVTQEPVRSVIHSWLDQEKFGEPYRSLLQLYIDLIESGGPRLLPGATFPVSEKEGLYAMHIRPKRHPAITPVFCYGPFSVESEITLLVGAPKEGGLLHAKDVLPIARHNLEVLLNNPKRRQRERIT